jgi:hypothetical protein
VSRSQPTRLAPDVDYLTRDYEGYRQLLIAHLDRSGTPWRERSAADAGVVVVEILANQLDHLAYAGDAVAAEAFLRTARRRESVRRHAALGDYVLSRGSASHGYQHFALLDGAQRELPRGAQVSPPLASGQNSDQRLIFETIAEASLDARRNRFALERSSASGTTLLRLSLPDGSRPDLAALGFRPGDRLCVRDRDKGEIVTVAAIGGHTLTLAEPLSHTYLAGSDDRATTVLGNLVRVRQGKTCAWTEIGQGGVEMGKVSDATYFRRRLDQLRALQARVEATREEWPVLDRGTPRLERAFQAGIEAARDEWLELIWTDAAQQIRWAVRLLREKSVLDDSDRELLATRLDQARTRLMSILTHLGWPSPAELIPSERVTLPGQRLDVAREGQEKPVIWFSGEPTLEVYTSHEGVHGMWQEVSDFLRSTPADRHYVVELDNRGQATLCFGDGVNGALLPAGCQVFARWVEGDIQARDLGAGALTRLVYEPGSDSEPAGSWLKQTWNPLPTCDASPPEVLEQVPRKLRLALREQVIPVTHADYTELLARLPGVAEAVVLQAVTSDHGDAAGYNVPVAMNGGDEPCPPTCTLPVAASEQDWPAPRHAAAPVMQHHSCAPTVHVVLRAEDCVDVQATIRAAQEWANTHRLAGTSVSVNAARDLHATIELIIDVHREMAVDDVRFRLREAILQHMRGAGEALLGRARHRAEIYAVAETVPGVAWSRVIGFRRANQPGSTCVEVITPEPDQIVRCLDLPDRPLAGTITIWRVVQYGLDIEVCYRDPDMLPGFGWIHGYLRGLLSGVGSIPMRDGWPELTSLRIDQVLSGALGAGSAISLRTRALLRGQRSVQRIPLSQGDASELESLRLIPVWRPASEKRGPCP